MPTKREHAHACARRGFAVFPIVPNAKQPPIIKGWQTLATTDPEQIDKWWAQWPDANIGRATADGLVVDIDPRNGGMETYVGLAQIETIPQTLVSRTQSGGNHAFFALPEGISVSGGTHKLGPGVDIKSAGGYVVLPGSTVDGREYTWANACPIAQAPAWMIERCNEATPRSAAAGKRVVEEDDIAIELFTKWIRERAPHAQLGEIDDTTFAVAARGYDFGCSEATVYELVSIWNETHCDGLGDLERLPVVVNSAGVNRDRPIGCAHPLAPGYEAVEIDESKRPAVTHEEQTQIAPKAKSGDMRAEDFFAAADMALTDLAEPLIAGILDRATMSILYGESNTGKTFIAIDMAFHVATAMAWAGRAVRKGCVVYVAAEGGRGVYKRLAALRNTYPDVKVVPLYVIKFPVDLLHGPEHAKDMVRLCHDVATKADMPLELIVIDTLSRAMSGGDENSSTDMGTMVKSFDALREVTGAHLMVIHHSGKDRARGARGHSLLRAATDTEIEIERGKITVTKQRDMDGDFQQHFKLKPVNIGTGSNGISVASCVVEFIKAGEAGAVEVAPTNEEIELVTLLRERMERLDVASFDWHFVPETYLEARWRRGQSEGAVYKVLQTLQQKRLIQKTLPGQYVTVPPPKLQTLQT